MASADSHSGQTRSVSVALPSRHINGLDNVNKIVASALGKLGCTHCFSGFDIRFTPGDLVVNPQTFEVNTIG